MRIDLKKLTGVHDGKIPFSGSADLSAEEIYGAHPFRHPAQYDGEIVNCFGAIKMFGTIKALYSTCCSRCLKPLDVLLTAQVEAVLSREDSEDENVFCITENAVEPQDVLVPELLLQVRMTYLCKEDCAGLCPQCGADRNETLCSCETKQVDPRLAALAALLKDKRD